MALHFRRTVAAAVVWITFSCPGYSQGLNLDFNLNELPPPTGDCDRLAGIPGDLNLPPGLAGVPFEKIDGKQAVAACRLALKANPSQPRFIFQLGRSLQAAGNPSEAAKYYRQAADLGYAAALTSLANLHADGRGVARDDARAVELYRQAVERGDQRALPGLGSMYERGRGVSRDYSIALRYYQQAADLGIARGIYLLALMYENGSGIAKDEDEAIRLLQQAAERGETRAEVRLATTLLKQALACPILPEVSSSYYSVIFRMSELYFVPDPETLAVTSKSITETFVLHTESTNTETVEFSIKAKFSELTEVSAAKDAYVDVQCRGQQNCIHLVDGSHRYTVPERSFELCDNEQAENLRFAINKLIQLNRGPAAIAANTSSKNVTQKCVVADPSGTPLNVRSSPNGNLTGLRLKNGTSITVISTARDPQGRSWARISMGQKAVGFVFQPYIRCN
jgi:TPR repeat protein